MQDFYKLSAKSAFFFLIGVVLASLFVWSMIEGLLVHLSGNATSAFVHYLLAWLAGNAAIWNYLQARAMFRYAKLT